MCIRDEPRARGVSSVNRTCSRRFLGRQPQGGATAVLGISVRRKGHAVSAYGYASFDQLAEEGPCASQSCS